MRECLPVIGLIKSTPATPVGFVLYSILLYLLYNVKNVSCKNVSCCLH